ncbi:MAG TPA: DNA-formamidopyrimidine glycosylase family protein [Egibacteraceae bacterium]|nr:DNA-formamidopyrimidine glycosylase family protein [Egibacteraceae bacterium]
MPEGHTIHRYAREHRTLLRGVPVAASSPQGRFSAGAAVLDGQTLLDAEGYGKHLFYRWTDERTLHVHLGLYGAFRRFDGDAPPPTPGTRLQLRAGATTLRLAGPTACDLIDPAQEERIRARLGPDPLRRDADPEQVWATLRRRATPVGGALIDQSVLAGIGNVFRCEALFLHQINPETPSHDLAREQFDALWSTLVGMLRDGVRRGRIITVDPAELGKTRRQMTVDDWRYVYRRTGLPCRRCGTPIVSWTLAARTMYACPRCQA